MTAPVRRTRGAGRAAVAVLVGLVVLVLLLVVADRASVRVAEREVAARLQQQLALAQPPAIDITDVPFLSQAVTNKFGTVNFAGQDVPTGTGPRDPRLARLDLRLTDVTTADGYRRISVGRLAGTASLSWGEVGRMLGTPVHPTGDGRVGLESVQEVYGQRFPLALSGRPVIDVPSQTITVTEVQVKVAGFKLPDAVVKRTVDDVVQPARIKLPLGLRGTSLDPRSDELVVGLEGEQVTLR